MILYVGIVVWKQRDDLTIHYAPSPTIVDLMLDQRRRRWTNIKPTLVQQLVFTDPLRPTFLSQSVVESES